MAVISECLTTPYLNERIRPVLVTCVLKGLKVIVQVKLKTGLPTLKCLRISVAT